MKKYINRNFFWSDLFVEQILQLGVRNVCISPGSRNTPLTMAFADHKSFKKHIHVDERSSGFFALGIAKYSKTPVAIVTTSGTAVAELYPAIIEAYIQRIPLIICTADRPDYLRNTGANQTINQDNIFHNHIRFFYDCGLPELKVNKIKTFVKKIESGLRIANFEDPGPIHFNLPFKKPLEPNTFTEDIKYSPNNYIVKHEAKTLRQKFGREVQNIVSLLQNSERPLIYCGWDNYKKSFYNSILQVSKRYNLPILADGTTNIRFVKGSHNLVLSNHASYINEISEKPDVIIQFGNAPTSQSMLKYFEGINSRKVLINKYGDIKDPSKNKGELIRIDQNEFLDFLKAKLIKKEDWKNWSTYLKRFDTVAENKKEDIKTAKYGCEPRIIAEVLKSLPEKSNLFISNSMPIRDFDLFASNVNKDIKIYVNRGASGIDGIISTATGIAYVSQNPTYLLIGDLAFYHNISALATLAQYKIPLKIILINNNGGGIFRMLPIANKNKYFEEYFNTAHNLDFSQIVKAFEGKHFLPKNWKNFNVKLSLVSSDVNYSVIEVVADHEVSINQRKEYLNQIKMTIRDIDVTPN